jgi:hypothetical protein
MVSSTISASSGRTAFSSWTTRRVVTTLRAAEAWASSSSIARHC